MDLFTERLYEQNLISRNATRKNLNLKIKNVTRHIKFRDLQNVLIIAVTLTFFLGITSFAAETEDISNEVLRLHILANSDSEKDQALKLKVRDRILEEGYEVFSGADNAKQAEKQILENSDALLATAREVVKEEGYDYDVTLKITDASFPTRTYDDITLPAGEYRAVQVVIGEGEGKNWWCVMFPALCLPGASDTSLDAVLTDDEIELVESDPELDIRFKVLDVFESFRAKLAANK